MVMTITNARAVQPYITDVDLAVEQNLKNLQPTGPTRSFTLVGQTVADMTVTIPSIDLVSVYVDGFRLVNYTMDFGVTYSAYTISGTQVVFNQPVTGTVTISIDLPFFIPPSLKNTVTVANIQGAKTKNTTKSTMLASYFCTPIVLTLPLHGSVCLSDDRESIVYLPYRDFIGYDTFSYTVITDRGQIAEPKCVYIKVGNPPKGG